MDSALKTTLLQQFRSTIFGDPCAGCRTSALRYDHPDPLSAFRIVIQVQHHRKNIMKIIQIALAALALALSTTAAAQDLQNQLIGTWDFVVAQVKAPDGKISFPFGES